MSLHRINRFATHRILHFVEMLLVVLSIECGLLVPNVQAKDSAEMSAVYGRGVHTFFANRMTGAEQLFSQVIQAGSSDPRVYYFRAMTRLRTGRSFEAEDDMKIGAAYEARDPGSRHSIGTALQRVQGQGRRTLERFRREGRLNRVHQRRQQSLLRYEQLEQRAPQVLRNKPPVLQEQSSEPSMQLSVPTTSPSPSSVPSEVPQTTSPLEAETEVAAPANAELSVPEAAPIAEEDNLFDSPAPNTVEASESASDSNDDFFGDPAPAEPAASEPATEEPVEGDEDPFADQAEIEDTASSPDPPMADESVATEEEFSEPAAEGDLFGETGNEEEGTEEEKTEETPAESESGEELNDLFGDSDSSESAVDTDEPVEDAPIDETSDSAESDSTDSDSADSEEEDPFGDSSTEETDESEAAESDEAEPMEESTESDDLFGDFLPSFPNTFLA